MQTSNRKIKTATCENNGQIFSWDKFISKAKILREHDGIPQKGQAFTTADGNSVLLDIPDDVAPFVDLHFVFPPHLLDEFKNTVMQNATGKAKVQITFVNSSDPKEITIYTYFGARAEKTNDVYSYDGPIEIRLVFTNRIVTNS